jgi:hypothetical protein
VKYRGIDGISKRPHILILGRKISLKNLAVWYAVFSFLLIFILGTDMGGAPNVPFAVLYSWVGLLIIKISIPVEALLNRYGIGGGAVGPIGIAILLFISILIYLMILFRITKATYRISRPAGLIVPLLLHFFGSFLWLMPHSRLDLWMLAGWRVAFYYASCIASLALVVGYILLSWLIVKRS